MPSVVVARAIATRKWRRATTILTELACRAPAAYVHLGAAEELARAGKGPEAASHAAAALAFYRSVGAIYFVQKAHALWAGAADSAATA